MAEAIRLHDDPRKRAFCLIGFSGLRWRLYWDRNFGTDSFILLDAARAQQQPWSEVSRDAPGGQVAKPPPGGSEWTPLDPEEMAEAAAVVLAQPDGLVPW